MNRFKVARLLLLGAIIAGVGFATAADARKIAHKRKAKGKVVVKNSPVAKEIFGHQVQPAPLPARAIGGYAKGCAAGAKALPIDGPAWQAMRLSRNRNWGLPVLLTYIEKLATEAKKDDGWNGLMVGDLSQPMGGPMLTGHASHQIGLDVDIWLKQMPARILTREERETEAPVSMLAADGLSVSPAVWTESHLKLIKRAASYPQVARIFVHPAIKKALCEGAGTTDRGWLNKVRSYWGHHYHFHIRLACPAGMKSCQNQPPNPAGDGCGKEVETWLKAMNGPPKPEPKTPPVQKNPLTLADLPSECAKLVGVDPHATVAVVPTGPVPLPERKPADLAKPAAEVIPASVNGRK